MTNANGTVTYSPATNFFGANHFTYTISDGQGGSATGMVSVTVIPALKIKSIARQSNGNILILFQGKPASNYVMEGSADFLSWSNLGNLSEGNPGAFQFVDTGTAGVDKRFYRVLAP